MSAGSLGGMLVVVCAAVVACSRAGDGGSARPDEAPQATARADSLIQYPPRLFDNGVEGDVVLRVFVDSAGRVRPESTRVAESSGSALLDSAARAGVERMKYSPAKKGGVPVATTFLQPIEFRHPNASAR